MTARGAVLIYHAGCFAAFLVAVTLYWTGRSLLTLIFPLAVAAWKEFARDEDSKATACVAAVLFHILNYLVALGLVSISDGIGVVPLHGHEVRWASAAACAFLWHGLMLGCVIVRLFISGYRSAKPRVIARIETAQRVVAAIEAVKHKRDQHGAVSIAESENAGRLSLHRDGR